VGFHLRAVVKNSFNESYRRAARLAARFPGSGPPKQFVIFVLHAVAPASSDMAVRRDRLEEQLTALLRAGYKCLGLEEMLTAVTETKELPGPSFALTFDDGYRSVYEEALPVLEQFGLPATVFLTVGFLDGTTVPPWRSQDPALLEEYRVNAIHFPPLNWNQARELAACRTISIGSHSMSHPLMGVIDGEELALEAGLSRKLLEDRLGVKVRVFSYPYGVRRYGAYSEQTENCLRSLGYAGSFTSEIGRARIGSGAWMLPRIPLTSSDHGIDALAKAAGRYDWMAAAQRTFQRVFPNPHLSSAKAGRGSQPFTNSRPLPAATESVLREFLSSAKAGRGLQPSTNSPTTPSATESVLREFLSSHT
jgi:peptidoglycan/xylan/chitin deacetylase (PgdA/CDA1 family)